MRLLLFALLFSVIHGLAACQSSDPVELQPCGVPGGTCEDNNPLLFLRYARTKL